MPERTSSVSQPTEGRDTGSASERDIAMFYIWFTNDFISGVNDSDRHLCSREKTMGALNVGAEFAK